jgi:imidazolonepropionase-like amidohydrolase
LDSLQAAVAVGRKSGKHTSAHVLAKCAIEPCVSAGVRTIEHCMWRVTDDRYDFDPQLAQRIADGEHYAGFTMTAPTWRSVMPEMANIDPALMGDLDVRFENERRTIDAGVKFTLHTDAGVRRTPFGESLAIGVAAAVRELRLTPLEGIQAVTKTAAAAIGLTDRGELLTGKRADMLIVKGNPSHDIQALHHVKAVMKAGTWMV